MDETMTTTTTSILTADELRDALANAEFCRTELIDRAGATDVTFTARVGLLDYKTGDVDVLEEVVVPIVDIPATPEQLVEVMGPLVDARMAADETEEGATLLQRSVLDQYTEYLACFLYAAARRLREPASTDLTIARGWDTFDAWARLDVNLAFAEADAEDVDSLDEQARATLSDTLADLHDEREWVRLDMQEHGLNLLRALVTR